MDRRDQERREGFFTGLIAALGIDTLFEVIGGVLGALFEGLGSN